MGFSKINVGGNLGKQKEETIFLSARVNDASKLDKKISISLRY